MKIDVDVTVEPGSTPGTVSFLFLDLDAAQCQAIFKDAFFEALDESVEVAD